MKDRGLVSSWAVGALAAVAGLAAAGPAQAAQVSLAGGELSIAAAPGEENVVTLRETALGEVEVTDNGPVAPVAQAPGCQPTTPPSATVVCSKGGAGFDPAQDSFVADLSDGNDRLDAAGFVLPGTIAGGAGDDDLTGGGARDEIAAGDGNDIVFGEEGTDALTGGAGDDSLLGDAGADALDGGAGADTLIGDDGDDALDGGAGEDSLSGGAGANALAGGADDDSLSAEGAGDDVRGGGGFDFASIAPPPAGGSIGITLDGAADDGLPGDGTNVHPDVEAARALTGAADAAVMRGNPAANLLEGGRGGDDIDPGDGPDSVLAGAGDDVVNTVDGHQDMVLCGSGDDAATVDPFDTASGCEDVGVRQVDSAFAGAPSAPPAPLPAATAPGDPPDATAPAFRSLGVPARLTRRQLRGGVRVVLAVGEAAAADVALGGRLRRGTIARAGDLVLAERTLRLGAARRTVTLKLGRAALRTLPRRGRFRLSLRITLTDAAGNRSTRTRSIVVR